MALVYGFVKCKVVSQAELRGTRHGDETEFHLFVNVDVASDGGDQTWQAAINVGSDNDQDLVQYRLVSDFQHPIRTTLTALPAGFNDLTGQQALPALDFLRSDVLAGTGDWTETDPMDGTDQVEPIASMITLLETARQQGLDTYIFGHTFDDDGMGIHDVHMNQGSTGTLLDDPSDANKDHNAIWQDGAVLIDLGNQKWAAYFTAFAGQLAPTDDLGNPVSDAHPIGNSDPGSLIGS